jgi:hypothetical protein
VAAQRGHRILEAPHTKTKPRACPTWTPAPNTHARFATAPGLGLGREVESREKQSTVAHPWDAGSGRLSRGAQATGPPLQGGTGHRPPFGGWRRPPAPAAWAAGAGERRGRPCPYVGALLTARATATHRQHGADAQALRRLAPPSTHHPPPTTKPHSPTKSRPRVHRASCAPHSHMRLELRSSAVLLESNSTPDVALCREGSDSHRSCVRWAWRPNVKTKRNGRSSCPTHSIQVRSPALQTSKYQCESASQLACRGVAGSGKEEQAH